MWPGCLSKSRVLLFAVIFSALVSHTSPFPSPGCPEIGASQCRGAPGSLLAPELLLQDGALCGVKTHPRAMSMGKLSAVTILRRSYYKLKTLFPTCSPLASKGLKHLLGGCRGRGAPLAPLHPPPTCPPPPASWQGQQAWGLWRPVRKAQHLLRPRACLLRPLGLRCTCAREIHSYPLRHMCTHVRAAAAVSVTSFPGSPGAVFSFARWTAFSCAT